MIEIKPSLDTRISVVASINLPHIWDSQIIVFFGDEYFQTFFYRNNDYQIWTPLADKRNIERELNLQIPKGLNIKGYTEVIIDEDFIVTSQLWFIGELN